MPTAADLVDRLTLTIADFPEPGVQFRDLTPTLADAAALRSITEELVGAFAGGFDLVAGIEARGFLLAAAAAYAAGTGVVAVRKAGKLPPRTLIEHYELEYGAAALEIRADQLVPGTRVLVLDDVLATGGTVDATCTLLERAGAVVAGVGVVLELAGFGGRERLAGRTVHAVREVAPPPFRPSTGPDPADRRIRAADRRPTRERPGMLPVMSQKRARALRSQSAAPRPRRAQQVVRATGPADLLRHVPDLLPVDPADSLVLILFAHSRGTRSRTQGAMRVDLRHSQDADELTAWAEAVLGPVLRVDGVTGVAIAAYTPEAFGPSGRPPAAAQVRAVARQAERMGLEVLDRFCVGADGWGSLADPELPRGGHPLSLLEPEEPRAPRRDPVAKAAPAPEAQRDRFADHHDRWWSRPEGPGGVLHGVDLGRWSPASALASTPALLEPSRGESAMDRYRWGRDVDAVVALVEGVLAPHDDAGRPCPCRALLLSLVVRQGLIGLLLAQVAWGPAFGKEVWTAVGAPDGRRRSIERLMDAIGGGRFRRPDTDRIDAGIAALQEVASYVDLPRTGAGIDEALGWLHWAGGASSTAGRLAERALAQDRDRDIAPILLARTDRGVLPQWAFRKDPRKPERFAPLLTAVDPSDAGTPR